MSTTTTKPATTDDTHLYVTPGGEKSKSGEQLYEYVQSYPDLAAAKPDADHLKGKLGDRADTVIEKGKKRSDAPDFNWKRVQESPPERTDETPRTDGGTPILDPWT